MSKSRKKQSALSAMAAISILALTVALLTLLVVVILTSRNTEEPSVTPSVSSQSTPIVGSENSTTPSVTTDGSLPVTPSETTTSSLTPSETVPNVPVTTTKAPETTTVLPPVTEPVTEYQYHIDMNKYKDVIDPTGDLWDDAYLLLVNAKNPIGNNAESGYAVLKGRTVLSNCADYKFRHKPSIDLNNTALKALSAMFLEAEAQGITTLDVTSAYRSYSYQNTLFNNNCNKTKHWVCKDDSCNVDWIGKSSTCPICGLTTGKTIPITREEQEANVATYSCAPGTSDHQTGLAVDVVQRSLPDRFDSLIQEFGETEAGKWLAANAHHFGFILRFPPDKEEITGIIYEPWHFRYVGRTHATAMYEMNLCLEEYVEYLTSTGYFN